MSLFSVATSECVSAPGPSGIRKTIASCLFVGFLIVLHAATQVPADADALSNRESLGIDFEQLTAKPVRLLVSWDQRLRSFRAPKTVVVVLVVVRLAVVPVRGMEGLRPAVP